MEREREKEKEKERNRSCSPADGLVPQPETLFEDSVPGICISRMVAAQLGWFCATCIVAAPRDTCYSIFIDSARSIRLYANFRSYMLSREIIDRQWDLRPFLPKAVPLASDNRKLFV